MSDNWVAALHDHNAGINTFLSCTTLTDLQGDGDYKLVLADLGTSRYHLRLKVYKGIQLVGESVLNELPSAIVSFNNETTQPSLPAIAVASGSALLIYKNLKPFYKFTVPTVGVNEIEAEAWGKARNSELNAAELHSILSKLRIELGSAVLTALSQTFLITEEEELEDTFKKFLGMKVVREDIITCLTTIKKSSLEVNSIDYLVIGTENGMVYCVDTQAFTVLARFSISGAPAFLHAAGMYDVDYRIFVCNRDSEVFILKRGVGKLDKPNIFLKSDLIGLTRVSKQLVLASDDQLVSFYSMKGKCLKQLKFESRVVGVQMFQYEPRQYLGVLVALEKEVRLYQDYLLVDCLKYQYTIKWIRFGQFGREEGALIVGTKGFTFETANKIGSIPASFKDNLVIVVIENNSEGGLVVHLFRRTAKLEERMDNKASSSMQNRRLNIPKKTKIYVDQANREKEQARNMHQIFQRDLFMLKLSTARAFAEMLNLSMDTLLIEKNKIVEISAEVNGFGPVFRLGTIIRTVTQEVLTGLWILFDYDPGFYDFADALIPLPPLISQKKYIFDTVVTYLNPELKISKEVRVYLADTSKILVSVIVAMPISESSLID